MENYNAFPGCKYYGNWVNKIRLKTDTRNVGISEFLNKWMNQ